MDEHTYVVETSVKNEQLVEKRRQQIIASAVTLFIQKGFHETTTKEIADGANMSVGTMFQYVRDKQDILYLVCCHIHGKIEKEIFAIADVFEQSEMILRESITRLFNTMAALGNEVLIMYRESASMKKESLRSFLMREQRLCLHLEQIMIRGIDEGVFTIKKSAVPLLAEDILVQAQMWAFRRWSLHEKYTIHEYVNERVYLLMKQVY